MRSWKFLLPLLASSLSFALQCFAVQPDRITAPIDSSQVVALKGNVHGLAQPRFDLGRTDGSKMMYGVSLAFHPSAAQQKDLDNLLAQQQDRSSPNYHKWLTPAQFADRFGMTKGDINRVVAWLESRGFTVTSVANSRNQISFEGTVAQVESAFAIEIHNYLVDSEIHFANATNPSVPAALAGSVLSVGHLHNFSLKPRAMVRRKPFDAADPNFTSFVSGNHFVSPADFATIYDVLPLYSAGVDGTGQKIALTGQSSINLADVANFRSAAGLPANVPTLLVEPNTGTSTRCSGDEGESDLDVEWSAAVAKNAKVTLVYAGLASGDTCSSRQFGAFDALQYAIDQNLAPIISNSYGNCEANVLLSGAQTIQGWIQQANTQGQTVTSSSGDSGAADCDFQVTVATHGFAVDIPAAIPEVTGMGGTEFNNDAEGGTPVNGVVPATQYWSGTNGSDTISSALSYIPEMGWNDTTFNLANGGTIGASGGGASIFFSKPVWQTGTGVPNDGQRDVPDIALNASPDHDGYLFCSEDGANGAIATTCSVGFRDGAGGNLAVVGGTSAGAPTMAGIIALLNQYLGASGMGNINPNLYSLAASNPSAFHDITTGNNIVPCANPSTDCPTTAPFQYGFTAGTGYDQVTGLGSVDAHALAVAWGNSRPATSTTISPSSTSVFQGASVTFTATVSPATATGMVSFYNNGSATALGTAALSGGTAMFSTTALPAGSDSVTATYNGNLTNNVSTSVSPAVVNVTVPFTMSAGPSSFSVPAGQSTTATLTITPASGFSQAVSFTSSSCSGLPAGASCSFSNGGSVQLDGNPADSKTLTLTITTTANMALPSGPQTVTITGTSGSSSNSTTVSLTVTATNQSFTLNLATGATSENASVAAGGTSQVSLVVNGTNGFVVASSSTTELPLTYSCTGLPSESTCAFSPGGGSAISATAVTVNVGTTPPTAQLRLPLERRNRIFYALLLPGIFGIVFAAGSRSRGARLLGLIVVLSFSTLWLGACGSSSSQKNPGTTPGTYAVIVKATTTAPSGGTALTASFTVNLTVTP
jgi:hypothetical protein